MSLRQLIIAAAILATAVYLKYAMPSFSDDLMPVVRTALSREQLAITVPEEWAAWLRWD